jgi:5-methylcytosine-specific restriction enzyme B
MVIPKQSDIEVHLLETIHELGDAATTQDIYKKLEKKFPELTEEDKTKKREGSSVVIWWNTVQWVRQKLVDAGEIVGPERGIWAITDKGLQRIGQKRISKKLHPIIYEEILNIKKQLEDEGKIYSQENLNTFFATFRDKFGPEVLERLDGQDLLNILHGPGSENLHYWLEFKDDDEFRGIFGSIAGGSSLKFGLYKRKETGQWMMGSPQNQIELSLDKAIETAREHKNQLLKGCELLEKLPENATDEEYEKLQKSLDEVSPDVSDSAWGHKYFALLFSNKLDDYHMPEYQRYHLIKILQKPADAEGRYASAGKYVSLVKDLGIQMNIFTSILTYRDGKVKEYWRIGTSVASKADKSKWELMKSGNFVAIGWSDIGDLTDLENLKESRDHIKELLQKTGEYKNDNRTASRKAGEIFNFRFNIEDKSIVLAANGNEIIGIGRVRGSYYFDDGDTSDFPHRIPVDWLNFDEWNPEKIEGLNTSVFSIKNEQTQLDVETKILGKKPIVVGSSTVQVSVSSKIFKIEGIPREIKEVLERKSQVILYGPPGTGKTYWAEIAAKEICAFKSYNLSFNELNDDQKNQLFGNDSKEGLIRICTFHPEYGYEDFIERYKPEKNDSKQLIFELREGIFKRLCNDAKIELEKKSNTLFILIIDEINRGDIPRIFGELLTILEKNKRGKKVILPLSGQAFYIPENIYIIGTMNTSDRSISLLDKALRRRFGFIELMPNSSILGDTVIEGIPLAKWLDNLNERILNSIGKHARNLQIGHSYFLENEKPIKDFKKFSRVIKEDIIPLLEDYCYEDYEMLSNIIGKGLIDKKLQKVKYELFTEENKEELISKLMEVTPDLTSTQIVTETEVVEPFKETDEKDNE